MMGKSARLRSLRYLLFKTNSAAATGRATENLWNSSNHVKGWAQAGQPLATLCENKATRWWERA
jgi:hypothetical protein